MFGITGKAFTVHALAPLPLGPLAAIPIIGPALFNQNLIVYAAFAIVPILAWMLSRTRYGLELRAAGENPQAADALGLGVRRLRWHALIASGVLTGLSGAYLTLAYANTFVEGISAGRGFVALAVVILGRWNPWGLAAASILFGAAMALQFGLQALGTRGALPTLPRAAVRAHAGRPGRSRRPGAGPQRARRAVRAIVTAKTGCEHKIPFVGSRRVCEEGRRGRQHRGGGLLSDEGTWGSGRPPCRPSDSQKLPEESLDELAENVEEVIPLQFEGEDP